MGHADILEEAHRLLATAEQQTLTVRVLGGIAVYLRCQEVMGRPELTRSYGDIDLAAPRRAARQISEFLTGAGYSPNRQFNALQGASRLLFYDLERNRQVDVFLGRFAMCHALDLEPRLALPGPALSPSDLLLLKLQIVELNRKDITDALALLLAYEPGPEDTAEWLSTDYIAGLCAGDWGWYTTLHDNLEAVASGAPSILRPAEATRVQARVATLLGAMEAAPKTLGWRLRDRIGRRKVWYELPEEVQR